MPNSNLSSQIAFANPFSLKFIKRPHFFQLRSTINDIMKNMASSAVYKAKQKIAYSFLKDLNNVANKVVYISCDILPAMNGGAS